MDNLNIEAEEEGGQHHRAALKGFGYKSNKRTFHRRTGTLKVYRKC
jgi:hypothetical protein